MTGHEVHVLAKLDDWYPVAALLGGEVVNVETSPGSEPASAIRFVHDGQTVYAGEGTVVVVVRPAGPPPDARALLREASDALLAAGKAALTVKPTLDKPYRDAPEWSPWTRFMEKPARAAYNLGSKIRGALAGALPAPTDPELADRVAALLRRCEEIDRTTWHADGDPSGGGHIATREVWQALRPSPAARRVTEQEGGPPNDAIWTVDRTAQWAVFCGHPDDDDDLVEAFYDRAEAEELAQRVIDAYIARRWVSTTTTPWEVLQRCSGCGSVLDGELCCEARHAEIEAGEAVLRAAGAGVPDPEETR